MPGEQRQTQTQNTSSTTRPWDMATGDLRSLMNQFNVLGRDPSYGANLNGAFSRVREMLGNVPNMGSEALSGIQRLFGSDTSGAQGTLNNGYADLTRRLGGIADGGELNPYTTPGFGDAISRMTGDITNSVKGVYNASGRDPSGAGSFGGNLAQKLGEGIAPVIQSQYNTNNANRFGAANTLFNAAGTTANNTTALGQVPLDNILKAISASGQLPGLYTGNAAADLALTQQQQDAPWTQASRWLQGILPIASLGSQTTGTGTSTRVQPENTFSNILGGGLGLASLFSGGANSAMAGLGSSLSGIGSTLAPLLGFLGSDERIKENVAPVGKLDDGQTVYAYNYKGDNIPQIGLMAQEVEKVHPEAVAEFDGVKHVHYGKATEVARSIGMARKFKEAA
jgi:hypothetical protein